MNVYLFSISKAILTFPLIAFIITLPFMIINYNKYGAISKLRTLIIYSFVLYLLCSIFLVILPLPSREYVSILTIPKYQLIPFNFVNDLKLSMNFSLNSFSSFIKLLKMPTFYQPLFNIILTIPFGMYLRYYYKSSFKKTLFFSLLLTLFFEITQLTGIFGIYSRNYRMFDVDDIIFNTIGALIGYLFCSLFIKILPSRESIDNKSFKMGEKVTGLRRLVAFIIDNFFSILLFGIILIISLLKNNSINYLDLYLYFIVSSFVILVFVPIIFNGRTIGKSIVKLKINDKFYKIFIRVNLKFISFYLLPFIIFLMIYNGYLTGIFLVFVYFIFLLISIYELFSNKEMWYEKLTKTKNISTIKIVEGINT